MDLSIIVVNYKTRDITRACLDSVIQHTKGIDYEIILVDNASDDGLVEIVKKKYINVSVIANKENLGFAKANNQGIKIAKGRHVMLLNSDTLIFSNQFKGMVQFMDKHPEVGVMGPKLLNEDGSLQYSAESFPTVANVFFDSVLLSRFFKKNKLFGNKRLFFRDHETTFECDKVMGAVFMINGEALKKLKGLDEDYFMYFEETDFCYRVKKAGWKVVYRPEFEVMHLWNASSRTINLVVISRSIRSMTLFFHKNRGLFQAACVNVLQALGSLLLFPTSLLGVLFRKDQRQRLYFLGNLATVQYYFLFGWVRERFVESVSIALMIIASITVVLERFVFSSGIMNLYLYHFAFAAIVFWAFCIALRNNAINRLVLPKSMAWKLLYIYFAYMLLSFIWGPDVLHSLRAFIKLAIYLATIKSIDYLLPRKVLYKKILDFQVPLAVVVSLVTWLQMLLWEYKHEPFLMLEMIGRPNVGFTEPDWLAIYLAFSSLYFFIRMSKLSWQKILIGSLLLSALILSSARGAYLSFALVYAGIIFATAILSPRQNVLNLLKERILLVAISGIAAMLIIGLTVPVYADYLMARLSLNEVGILSRLDLVQDVSEEIASSARTKDLVARKKNQSKESSAGSSSKIGEDEAVVGYGSMVESERSDSVTKRIVRLLVGRGLGSWGYYLGMRERGIPLGGGAFNFLISNFYELGIFGIISLLAAFLHPFLSQIRKLTIESATYLLLASTFFINGMFSNTYLVAFAWFLTFISIQTVIKKE